MNVITGKKPLVSMKGFNGLFARGAFDACPMDHLTDCYNCIFPGKDQVSIRENFTVQNDIVGATIISFAIVTLASGAALLTLNSTGNLVDETHNILLGGPFAADDFTALSIFGRAYISLRLKGKALVGGVLYYYDGVSLKVAGGAAPAGAVTLAQPNAGTVDPGTHAVWQSYITATGFLTPLSPSAAIVSTGANTISISNIALGPVGTLGRVLFISRANELEPFFIPNGQINDNVTTTFEYTGFDTSLIVSADYLNNILSSIPGCAALKFYKGRLVLIGRTGSPDSILVSDQNSPETFNLVNNVVNLPVDYGINTSSGGMIIRSVLYVTKPNGTYSVQDNGGHPNTWGVDIVDSGIGAFDVGLSVFASSMSAQDVLDSCLVVNKRGVVLFNGAYSDVPLTYKIQSIWDLVDANYFYKVQIAHDIWNKRVYIAVPLDPAGTYGGLITRSASNTNNILLMMDYSEGLNPGSVKWSVWTYNGVSFTKIAVENFTLNYTDATMIYQLAFCSGGTLIYKLNPPTLVLPELPDLGHAGAKTAIQQYIITAPIRIGGITTFSMLNFQLNNGNGAMKPSLYDQNRNTGPIDYRVFTLNTYALSMELQRLINMQTEGIQVQLSCSLTNPAGFQSHFWLTGLEIYGTVMYSMRPALVEST